MIYSDIVFLKRVPCLLCFGFWLALTHSSLSYRPIYHRESYRRESYHRIPSAYFKSLQTVHFCC